MVHVKDARFVMNPKQLYSLHAGSLQWARTVLSLSVVGSNRLTPLAREVGVNESGKAFLNGKINLY